MVASASAPKIMDGFEDHVVYGEPRGTLPLTKATEFWLVAVNTFDALYEAIGTS